MKFYRARLTFATANNVISAGQVFCLSEGDELSLPPSIDETRFFDFYEEIDVELLFSGRGADIP